MDGFDMNGLNGLGGGIAGAPVTAALAWQMFVNSGEPGMYMLYNDLMRSEEDELFR